MTRVPVAVALNTKSAAGNFEPRKIETFSRATKISETMKIETHQVDRIEDGTIYFFVDRKFYPAITDHLKRKGYSASGRETTDEDGQSMVICDCPKGTDCLEALNQALE